MWKTMVNDRMRAQKGERTKEVKEVMRACYHSTRNASLRCTAKQAILNGLASDGGLYVFEHLKAQKLDLIELMEMDYCQTAQWVLSALLPDYDGCEIHDCVKRAYGDQFTNAAITPLVKSGKDRILELFHGPTGAFKDIALQLLPQLMSTALAAQKDQNIMILTATSGDTGKAALCGFQDVDHIAITVFYPDQGVSAIQRLQMVTQSGRNLAVSGIHGNFDDAQSEVKKLFHDAALKQELMSQGITLSSANSINIGRLIPQIVYYLDAYRQMVAQGEITLGEKIDFCVPTGNFGNVLAGYYAKQMGLPIRRLIVACNANHVLHDFISTGVYDRNRPFHKTISPSMDILISSNLERLLYDVSGGDCGRVQHWMHDLQVKGRFCVDQQTLQVIQETFVSAFISDRSCASIMKAKYEQDAYVMDPHTACGYGAMKQLADDAYPCVLLATASPYKFCHSVYAALFGDLAVDEFTLTERLERQTQTQAPQSLKTLKECALLHEDVIERQDMRAYVKTQARRLFQ